MMQGGSVFCDTFVTRFGRLTISLSLSLSAPWICQLIYKWRKTKSQLWRFAKFTFKSGTFHIIRWSWRAWSENLVRVHFISQISIPNISINLRDFLSIICFFVFLKQQLNNFFFFLSRFNWFYFGTVYVWFYRIWVWYLNYYGTS